MNGEENKAIVPVEVPLPEDAEVAPLNYWGRVSKGYLYAFRALVVVLILFVVMFTVLCSGSFTYDGFFYFGKDIGALSSLAGGDRSTVYYTYGEAEMHPLAYRGGTALVHSSGVEVYAAGGKRLLAVERNFRTPRAAVSRNYLVAFDQGGTDFSVCNSYAELYRGKTELPIYGVQVSDAGYFAVITASTTALSEVLVYDSSFHLIQRLYRGSATVSAVISENGRYLALLGALSDGALLDVFVIGDPEPISSHRFENESPLSAGFTSSSVIAVITDRVVHTMNTEGKRYGSFSFAGKTPVAYSIGREGTVVALSGGTLGGKTEVVVLDKKGNAECECEVSGAVRALSISDGVLWLLTESGAEALRVKDGTGLASFAADRTVLGISALAGDEAYLFYPARAVKISVDD